MPNGNIYLYVEVPAEENNNTLKVSDFKVDKDELHVFQRWYEHLGHKCNSLDVVRTKKGLIFVDDIGLHKPQLTHTRLLIEQSELNIAGNMIIVKGQTDSGEMTYFDENSDHALVNYWMNTLKESDFATGEQNEA